MRRRSVVVMVGALVALVLVSGMTLGQGRGMGRGNRSGGMGMGCGGGQCMGSASSAMMRGGTGRGAGGWWTRLTPGTSAQKAFVDQVARLHGDIRATNFEIASLRSQEAAPGQIARKQQEVSALQSELGSLSVHNAALLREMRVPAGCGVCDGTGPKASCPMAGNRGGAGAMRGNGMGPRNGTGPNPNCPRR